MGGLYVMRVEPSWKGLVSLWNRPQRTPSALLPWDNIAVSPQLWTRNAGALLLNFLCSRTVRNKIFVVKSCSLWYFFIVDKTDEDNVKMFSFSSFSIQSLEFMRWSEYTSLLSKAWYLVIKSHSFTHSSNIYCASALSQTQVCWGYTYEPKQTTPIPSCTWKSSVSCEKRATQVNV